MTGDYLVRATALDGKVRAFALRATELVEEMRARHDTFPAATAALGRTAMGSLLLAAASLKEEDQLLTIEIRGGGPIGRILCTATGRGEVRGMVSNPHVHADSVQPGKLNVAGVVGSQGYLSITKDLGMREPYRGTVELQSGEIGDDFAYYLARSEQTPSAVGLGVFVTSETLVDAAGGFLVQLLPGLSEEEIVAVEREVAALPHPTRLIRDGLTPEQVLGRIFPAGFELLDTYPVRFSCPCSPERYAAAIVSLGSDEIKRIIEEEENDYTEVVCHFCNEKHRFSPADMQQILEAANG
ncbi:MAG: Hsp33 family molecular chaperone HslO [Gemmatimonadetes bacterium]|nr:Hsp33 family molecular chaperone HslO [Gemmatimonadota bacterium]